MNHPGIRWGPDLPLEEALLGGSSYNAAGQPADDWFIIGTTSRTAARKLVKNFKYAKIGLAVGTLDQFVMNFGAVSLWNG